MHVSPPHGGQSIAVHGAGAMRIERGARLSSCLGVSAEAGRRSPEGVPGRVIGAGLSLPKAALDGSQAKEPSPGTVAEHPRPARRLRHQRQRSKQLLVRGCRITMRGDAGCCVLLSTGRAGQPATPTHAGPSCVPGPPLRRPCLLSPKGRREARIPGSASWPECEIM